MPMHDWTRVDAGICHDFHHEWISEIKRALNRGLLPPDYYAIAEQVAAGFGPDVLTLQDRTVATAYNGGGVATQARPRTTYYTELPGEFHTQEKHGGSPSRQRGSHCRHRRNRLAGKQKQCQLLPSVRTEGLRIDGATDSSAFARPVSSRSPGSERHSLSDLGTIH